MVKKYSLPELPYGYNALEPHISEEQLKIHHTKHHNSYVEKSNSIVEDMQDDFKSNLDFDSKASLKSLSFNLGGYLLHNLFWKNLAPADKGGGGEPGGKLAEAINGSFGNFENFKSAFSDTAKTAEAAGWAALVYCGETEKLLLMQIEKHNTNIYAGYPVLMVLDMFEHAFYLDYKNEKAKYIEAFWNVVNWDEVNKRFEQSLKI